MLQRVRAYYLQSRYYDPTVGRFLNADAYVSTGQGVLDNNMFAYCKNNPINNIDPNGKDPVLFAAAGGALAGGLISLYFYLNNAGDDASFGEALLAVTGGAIAGALGGAASILTGDVRIACVLGAAIVAGLTSDATGGSFAISSLLTLLATYGGLYIDTSMYAGYELMLATYVASLGTGLPAEMASQAMHEDLYEFQTSNSISSTPRTGGGGHAPIGFSNTSQIKAIAYAY